MRWVTKDYVHLDRVACPWLIRRFIDPSAEFVFVAWDKQHEIPSDAIPFAIAGAELGPHDAAGTTFEKLLAKYKLVDPALKRLGLIIHAGVDYVLHDYRPAPDDENGQIAVGLLAISEGMMLNHLTDQRVLEASYPVYDALYANLKAHALMQARGLRSPAPTSRGPAEKTDFLRALLAEARSRSPNEAGANLE
jgi:hypothetical protein